MSTDDKMVAGAMAKPAVLDGDDLRFVAFEVSPHCSGLEIYLYDRYIGCVFNPDGRVRIWGEDNDPSINAAQLRRIADACEQVRGAKP